MSYVLWFNRAIFQVYWIYFWRGLKRTKEIYVKNAVNKIFESNNFNDLILKSEELRQKLYNLGCFKSIEVLIDSTKSKTIDIDFFLNFIYKLFFLKESNKKSSFDIYYDVEEPLWIGG